MTDHDSSLFFKTDDGSCWLLSPLWLEKEKQKEEEEEQEEYKKKLENKKRSEALRLLALRLVA